MKYILLTCSFLIFSYATINAQEKTYTLEKKKDILLTGVGLGLNIVGFSIKTEGATLAGINGLNENDLWALDRSAIYNNSQTAQTISDVILYSSMSIPFLIYSDKKCRSEGLTIGLMGFEAFLITNGITTITKNVVERYRPFTYNPDVPLDVKLGNGSRLSFFSGHTSVTTAFSFFAAKVLTDLRPDSNNKWVIWTIGASAPAIIGYLRFEAGKHFLTDVISGYALGAVVGYLVPAAHLNKNVNIGIGFAGTLDFRLTF
jgi:membrane-associated phospholipid phosphatase